MHDPISESPTVSLPSSASSDVPDEDGNRRHWTRVPADTGIVHLQWEGHTCQGVLLDESLDGIGVLLEGHAPLEADQSVSVRRGRLSVGARVKHVHHGEDQTHVGLQWQLVPEQGAQASGWSLAMFLKSGEKSGPG